MSDLGYEQNNGDDKRNASGEGYGTYRENDREETHRSSIEYVPSGSSGFDMRTPPKNGKGTGGGMKVLVCVMSVIAAVLILICGILIGNMTSSSDNSGNPSNGNYTSGQIPVEDGGNVIYKVSSTTVMTGTHTVAEVAAKVKDAVVEIRTESVESNMFYGSYTVSGAGSGVIINSNGLIITNYHVIDGASAIKVITTSGTEYTGAIVASDYKADLALVKINATGLPYATFGDSSSLVVGQEVVAIGNPLGELGGTVTNGIISALERSINVGGVSMTLLQTNAAINPGNSGGGLFDMNGNLIGIVNAKYSESGVEGLGFAIPADYVCNIIEEFVKNGGYVSGRAYLGISFSQGLYISSYEYSSELAEGEEIKSGDYLYAIDGIQVKDTDDVKAYLTSLSVGDTVQLTLLRTESTGSGWFGSSTRRYYNVTVTVHEYIPGTTNSIEFKTE